ncbi:L,D-transpeptidase family protein [Acinetobacter shaoyimingii]|uniref:L,D-transpeptidase family protein n=1 Tax=Acinetobacter shaoyimingii TaxID=2715164 RepID=A0A6G8RYA4_9GAMM|nr:L,D-transpeptidase family protein [Acinetobacter shaoyimingii]NHB58699.1 L,D-transpeptidase family protein [Acinetobacter shaoyimingii]QIO06830.1 L,D-transpeptidase family protein [Acinetobacter shaoyimingii]
MFKKLGSLCLILIVIIAGCTYGYYKLKRYLPSHPVQSTQALNQQDIRKIRQYTPITEVHVYKAERRLHLLNGSNIIRSYEMRLGFNPIGHKVQEGDGKTPEGRYILDWRNAQSAFYKSLHISYPNEQDKVIARQLGVSPGGDIMIHGSAKKAQVEVVPKLMKYMPTEDWTWGCIAVRNVDMDEIWQLIDDGTAIEIYP